MVAVRAVLSLIFSDIVFINMRVCLILIRSPTLTTPALAICGSNLGFNFEHSAGFLILLSTSQMQKSCLGA